MWKICTFFFADSNHDYWQLLIYLTTWLLVKHTAHITGPCNSQFFYDTLGHHMDTHSHTYIVNERRLFCFFFLHFYFPCDFWFVPWIVYDFGWQFKRMPTIANSWILVVSAVVVCVAYALTRSMVILIWCHLCVHCTVYTIWFRWSSCHRATN